VEGLEDRTLLATLTVTSNLDNGSSRTLRSAIAEAKAGDVIQFNPANFVAPNNVIALRSALYISKSLTITGQFTRANGVQVPVGVTLDGGNAHRVFVITSGPSAVNVTLNHLSIDHGRATDNGNPVDSTNTAKGGGIFINGSNVTVTIVDSTVELSQAVGAAGAPGSKGDSAYGGGIYDSFATLVIQNTRIIGNTATGGAGGAGVPGVNNGNGYAGGNAYGGGISSFEGHVTLARIPVVPAQQPMLVTGNTAMGGIGGFGVSPTNGGTPASGGDGGDSHGGGIYLLSASATNRGTLTTTGATILRNHANGGRGQIGSIGLPGFPGGGAGEPGGSGGKGGNATGGGIELANLARLVATSTVTRGNDAKAGDGGIGGLGGPGGPPTPDVPMFGPGGIGGPGGNSGDAFGGAIYADSANIAGTYTGGSIINNTVTDGVVGPGGPPGFGAPPGAMGIPGKPGKVKNGGVSTKGGATAPKPVVSAATVVAGNSP
jgi:hypothetical protein